MSGVGVVKRWHICEAFDDMKWGRYGRERRIGTGEGSGGQSSVVMWDSVSKGRGGRDIVDVGCRVRMMARDVAQWIRGWLPQNGMLIVSGGRESCWGSIGILM